MPEIFLELAPFIQQFLVVLLGSGASIAIANIVLQHKRDKRARAEAEIYLAIQLAFQLEGYVIRCANALSDHSTAMSNDGHAGAYIGSVPAFDPLPVSAAYQYFPSVVLTAILDLPQRRDMAQEFGMFYWNMLGDQDATHGALEEHTTRMAAAALSAADLLRDTYPVGARNLTFGKWDIREYIIREMQKIAEREDRERLQKLEAKKG